MKQRVARGLVAIALIAGSAAAFGDGAITLPSAAQDLLRQYPNARFHTDAGRVRIIYGTRMTAGQNAAEAATTWIADHGLAFGAGPLDLEPVWSADIETGRFTVFAYQQYLHGLPVEHGIARVLVSNGEQPRVVYAAGTLAPRPVGGFAEMAIDAATAIAIAQAEGYGDLTEWSIPELVAYQGEGEWTAPVRAWKIVGQLRQDVVRRAFTFFIDAATGQLINARSEIYNVDVNGSAQGWGSPGLLPDMASNPPALLPMSDLQVRITGGASAYTDRLGAFLIPHSGSSGVTVTSNVSSGRWVNVNPQTSAELTVSESVTPPGPAALVFNPTPSQLTTAQVNAFVHVTGTHNYFKDRAPTFTGLDRVTPANTAVSGSCNAFFSSGDLSVNFYNTGGGCNNSAYSTVISHEYGHFIVNRLGLGQGGFGEGYSDVTAMLLHDDHIIARFFTPGGGYIRDPEAANVQYPCASGAHHCGQILGGLWWDIREGFGTAYGSQDGLERARQMQVNWSLITTGGEGSGFNNSAHPGTAIEVLTVNDDDGEIANGTPDYAIICGAFSRKSISCPPLILLDFSYPDGRPTSAQPDQPINIRVDIVGVAAQPQDGSGQVTYRLNGGSFTSAPMTQIGASQYLATLPAVACGNAYDYYFSARTTTNTTLTDPADAPASLYTTDASLGRIVVLDDPMEADAGWAVGSPQDTAVSGVWVRVNPNGTLAQPEDDHTPGAGAMCFVTGQGPVGGTVGANDVDGGQTTLTTPTLDLGGMIDPAVSYWRWYSNDTGAAPNADTFAIDISGDGGITWTRMETVGPAGDEASGGWYYREFRVANFISPSANVKVRFVASDLGSGSIVEAAVDDFKVTGADCGDVCPADFDGDGNLTLADFVQFRNAYVAGDLAADFDDSGALTLADFVAFRNAYTAGCP